MVTQLFRISPEMYLTNIDGKGGSYQYGARWNPAGYPILYLACSASTAMLEMAHYIPHPQLVPDSYRLGVFELSSDLIDVFDKSLLPINWADYPHNEATQLIGKEWLEACSNVALRLPSSAVPNGFDDIVIVNPNHPKISDLKFIEKTKLAYNERMFSGMNS